MKTPAEPRPPDAALEQDDRFPSGPWTGFFLQKHHPRGEKHWMELRLTFKAGVIEGEGRDWLGNFLIKGRYDVADGKCRWSKRYLGLHDVYYQGYNEGKGIWGGWEIPPLWKGGFHIWPEAMGDPSKDSLSVAEELPVAEPVALEVAEPVGAPG